MSGTERKSSPRRRKALGVSVQLYDVRWKVALRPYGKTVESACAAALAASKSRGEVSVVLADDAFMRELNHTYRSKDKPTNVLSFPGDDHVGDIVLAYDTIEREASEQGKTLRHHATHLLVHGVLHLLGHDHMKAKEAVAMEAEEIKILKKLGVRNPYL